MANKKRRRRRSSRRIVSQAWEGLFDRDDFDAASAHLADDFKLHHMTGNRDEPLNRDALQHVVNNTLDQLPGARVEVDDQLTTRDRHVIIRFRLLIPPGDDDKSDEPQTFHGVTINRVGDEKIEESWLYWEAQRAKNDLEEPDSVIQPWSWRWPPWSWP